MLFWRQFLEAKVNSFWLLAKEFVWLDLRIRKDDDYYIIRLSYPIRSCLDLHMTCADIIDSIDS